MAEANPADSGDVRARRSERLWLSAAELRVVANEVGVTVVVEADLPVDLADIVKARRRHSAAALRIGGRRDR